VNIKENYYEDVQFLKSWTARAWFVVLIVFLVLFPIFSSNYYIYVANYIAINILVVLGLNILMGSTGLASLGHSGFYAVGAYTTVVLMTRAHLPFLLALLLAGLLTALFGFLIGFPALRLSGPYLAIATFAFGVGMTIIIGRIEFLGGRQGLHAPELIIGSWHLDTDKDFYIFLIPLMVFMALMARNILKTRTGRALNAIRDSDIAAETMGVNLVLYKTLAFAISAFYAGVAGGLYAFVLRFIEPEIFSMYLSIMFVVMIVVGGLGTIIGSISGAILISLLDLQLRNILSVPYLGEWLKSLSMSYFSVTGVSNIQFIIYGTILLLIMMFEPLGIYGFWLRIKKYWNTWPF